LVVKELLPPSVCVYARFLIDPCGLLGRVCPRGQLRHDVLLEQGDAIADDVVNVDDWGPHEIT
jgi:hypothetical protein